MRRSALTIGILALAFVLGTSGPATGANIDKPKTHSAITKTAAAKQYLALVAPARIAGDAFATEAEAWNRATTDAEAESDAEPEIAALSKLQTGLVDDRWPTRDRADVKALATTVVPLIADLRSLATLPRRDVSIWAATFKRHDSELRAAATIVRRDLGLPPAPV